MMDNRDDASPASDHRMRAESLAAELRRIVHPAIEHWTALRAARLALAVLDGGIGGPAIPFEHPDRLISCEADLASVFDALASVAEAAGWRPAEVAVALSSLADNHTLARLAGEDDAKRIAQAIRQAGAKRPT